MMKPVKSVAAFLPAMALGLLMLSGCGQVTGPISPIASPPYPAWGTFDDGTTDGWVFDYSNPVVVASPPALTVTTQSFQGADALVIPIPAQGTSISGGVTYLVPLTAYSVHYQPPSALNLTDMTLSMWVELASGLVTPPNQVGAQIWVKDTSYEYANGTFIKLVPGQWMEITYNVNAPSYQANPPPNLASIYQVGLQIAGNGSSVFTSNGVIYADSFGYQKNPY